MVSTNGHRPAVEIPSGYVLPRERVTFTWEEGPYAGVEVQVRVRVTVAEALAFARQAAGSDDDEPVSPFERRVRLFGERLLLGWNLARVLRDEDGEPILDEHGEVQREPIPATVEGLLSLPVGLVNEMLNRADEEYALPAPLSLPSSDGRPSVAPSTPQPESPSANRPNSKRRKS